MHLYKNLIIIINVFHNFNYFLKKFTKNTLKHFNLIIYIYIQNIFKTILKNLSTLEFVKTSILSFQK